ncbi:unnamed protein product [Heligmosomoides polygyrus]|uniref:Astacin domain-containing protein n=1 Tax=Heligmosomoides polygyrus TaxID=6339 RepID=A0A183GWR2_HELPZ|nr:unnamed protein product [Heligmosomoides polygyrus]
MNYGSTAGTKNGRRTITAKDNQYTQTLGSPFISFTDFYIVNLLYSCTGCSAG